MNTIHPNLRFTSTQEVNRTINFLDLTITRHDSTFDVNIQGVTIGTDQTSGECSVGQTIPI